jgi:hypothetical protein
MPIEWRDKQPMLKERISQMAHHGRPTLKLRTIVYFSAVALLTCVGKAGAGTVIGHVLDKHGDWQLYPEGADSGERMMTLKNGQSIPAGAAIRVATPSSEDYLIIVGLDLTILEQRRCQELESCYSPILLPKKAEESDTAHSFALPHSLALQVQNAWTWLWGEPYEWSLHRQRGGGPIMTDGVVALRNRSIDLGDIMRYARAGPYVLTRTEGADANKTEPQRIVFSWDPENSATVPVGDLSPGLFDINEDYAAAGTRPPSKDPAARILVRDASTYPDAVASFRKIRRLTDNWTDSVDPGATRAFLRSVLASLEKSMGASVPSKSR